MVSALALLGALFAQGSLVAAAVGDGNLIQLLGPQSVNLWRLSKLHSESQAQYVIPDTDTDTQTHFAKSESDLVAHFHTRWFEQPLDHFSKSTGANETWRQRYWVNDRHYDANSTSGKPVPIIVIDGGETSGEDRLPFLDTGIAEILANATGGIGVVLEHR